MSTTPASTARRDLIAVVFALLYPTLLTVVYFILLAKQPAAVQQATYGIGKTIQFLLPVAWFVWVQQRRLIWQGPRTRDLALGMILGLALLFPALLLYFAWLKSAGMFAAAAVAVREKIAGFGLTGGAPYIVLAIFYSAIHSLLEEYYWRWFVFAQLRRLTSFPSAAVVSSLGFMLHHVFVLGVYFGWTSPLTWLFSAAVALGGVIWAWMYEKTGSLYGPWVSHALVDAAIFIVGWDLL